MNDQFELSLNANQVEIVKNARNIFCEQTREINNIKECIKGDMEALIEDLGWEKKEHKSQIKALKRGFTQYAKQQQEEALKEAEAAHTIATL